MTLRLKTFVTDGDEVIGKLVEKFEDSGLGHVECTHGTEVVELANLTSIGRQEYFKAIGYTVLGKPSRKGSFKKCKATEIYYAAVAENKTRKEIIAAIQDGVEGVELGTATTYYHNLKSKKWE